MKKVIIVFSIVVSLFSISVVSASAAACDFSKYLCPTSISGRSIGTVIEYDSWNDFLISLPVGFEPSYELFSSSVTGSVKGAVYAVPSSEGGYAICNISNFRLVSYNSTYYVIAFSGICDALGSVPKTFYLCDTLGYLYVVRKADSSNSLLSSIADDLSVIETRFSLSLGAIESYLSRLVGFFDGQMSGIYYWINSINYSVAQIQGQTVAFFDGKTVTDIISAISSAADKTDILAALTNIENNTAEFNTKLGNLNITSSFDDSAILTALEPVTSFFSGNVRTTSIVDGSSSSVSKTIQYRRGTLSLLELDAPDDAEIFFSFDGTSTYYRNGVLSFDSSVVSYSMNILPKLLGITMKVDSDHIPITVADRKSSDCPVPAGTYDIFFFDEAGAPLALNVGDILLPGNEVGVWVIRRASDGSEVRIGSTTGLPDGYAFPDLFHTFVRFKVSDIKASPSLFSYWMDCVYRDSLNKSTFRIVSGGDGVSMSVSYEILHPLLGWFAQQQNGFQSWLDSKLDSLSFPSGGSSSDLTGVTTRLDTIIEELRSSGGEFSCEHTYTQEMTQAPTCILPGLQVSTCSKCGSSYSEIVSALGHDWQCTDHVEDETDPDTGEVTATGYDVYTCSRCGGTYNDYSGSGAPDDYGDTSISKIIVRLFSKLGTFAGKIISWIIGLFDKVLGGLDGLITRFSELTAQITGFGGDYPTWLSGFWGILPQELQLALGFSFVCLFVGLIGRKLFFA